MSAVKFPTHKALVDDILSDPKRMFPLGLAEHDELLEAMLIHVEGKHIAKALRLKKDGEKV